MSSSEDSRTLGAPSSGALGGSKTCPKCQVEKPLVDFGVRKKNPDGSVKYINTYCKLCESRRRNASMKARKQAGIPPEIKADRNKRCSCCKKTKIASNNPEISQFHPKDKIKHVVLTWQSRCKDCDRKSKRKTLGIKVRGKPYKKRPKTLTAEEKKAKRKAQYHENMKDPEFVARKRARNRMNSTLKRRRDGIPERNTKRPYPIEMGGHTTSVWHSTDMVPAAPLADWITSRPDTIVAIANAVGVDESRLRRIASHRQDVVTLGVVSNVLDRYNDGTMIHDLYPDE